MAQLSMRSRVGSVLEEVGPLTAGTAFVGLLLGVAGYALTMSAHYTWGGIIAGLALYVFILLAVGRGLVAAMGLFME